MIPLGLVLTLPDVVGLGAAALLAVTVAWVAIGTQRLESGRGALHVTRAVAPNPVVRDRTAEVSLLVAAHQASGAAYERLSRLRLSEQAAHELAGHQGIRARVSARADRITVHYSLTPTRRGRWSLGPLLTTRTDVFGLVRATQPLGAATHVPVWPRTVEPPSAPGRWATSTTRPPVRASSPPTTPCCASTWRATTRAGSTGRAPRAAASSWSAPTRAPACVR